MKKNLIVFIILTALKSTFGAGCCCNNNAGADQNPAIVKSTGVFTALTYAYNMCYENCQRLLRNGVVVGTGLAFLLSSMRCNHTGALVCPKKIREILQVIGGITGFSFSAYNINNETFIKLLANAVVVGGSYKLHQSLKKQAKLQDLPEYASTISTLALGAANAGFTYYLWSSPSVEEETDNEPSA